MSNQDFKYSLIRRDGFTLPGAKTEYAPDLGLIPFHTEIHLDLDLEQQVASGFARVHIRAQANGKSQLKLDAVDFEMLSVKAEEPGDFTYRYDGKHLHLNWGQPFKTGDETVVTVHYTLRDPITGLTFQKPSAEVPDFPLAAVTDNETERARYWFPCVDFPTVRTTMEYILTADAALTILANGKLIEETTDAAGRKTAHWKLDQPCPSYLACFAVGDFTRFDDEALRDIPIAYFADSQYTPEMLQRSFSETKPMLEWMEEKLGHEFPYPKYYQFAARGIGGAMENISLVSWDDKVILDETYAREMKYQVDLINVHEMAHSYFGDAIVAHDFAHVWLKESWATYIESVWLEDTAGKESMDWQMAEEARTYIQEAKNRYVRPIITRNYDHSWSMFDMHLYPGGAWRLHMLRHKVGDDAFWAGVRKYVNTYLHKTVESVDFQRCIESEAGINLAPFFDQWFRGKGYPKLKVAFSYDQDRRLGKWSIEQTQVDKKQDIPVLDLDLEIAWENAQGQPGRETLHLTKQEQVFLVKMDDPRLLVLDPDLKLLCETEFNPGSDYLGRLLNTENTVNARLQGISELCKTQKLRDLQLVADFMQEERFWGVRLHAYRCLGKVGHEGAFRILADLLSDEQDPMVLEGAANACGTFRHLILREAILKKLDEADLPYRARMALLSSLGKQRQTEDVKRLSEVAREESWRNLNRTGAFHGLGASRQPSAVAALVEGGDRQTAFYDEQVGRYQGIQAIYPWLSRDERRDLLEVLIQGTRTRIHYAFFAASRALAATGEPEARSVLESLRGNVSEQDVPALDRMLQSLANVAKPDGQVDKLKKEIEELKTSLAKMELRLQELENQKS